MTTHTTRITNKLGALALTALVAVTAATATARADNSDAILNALVKKGILTQQEASDLQTEVTKQDKATVASNVLSSKNTTGITFSGRLQVQYVNVTTTDDNNTSGDTNINGNYPYKNIGHAFLRRVYFGAKATLGPNWSANLNYDLADSSFDRATINWTGDISAAPFSFDIGLRKVNFAYDEFTSSGNLKSIERSGATGYFVNDANANGTSLGAASYHIGIFADYNPNAFAGKTTGFFAGAAITNPERQSSGGKGGDVTFQGKNGNLNKPAAWLNLGYTGKTDAATCILGAAAGYLPGMGGVRGSNQTGTANQNILQGNLYADITAGAFNIVAEYLVAKVDQGVSPASTGIATTPVKDATVYGFWIQPSVKLGKQWELVARYSYTNTDGRGILLGDGIRSASSAVKANALNEYYLGVNYYIIGNDLKLQLGYIGGQTSGALPGSTLPLNKETANGIRTQMQVNF